MSCRRSHWSAGRQQVLSDQCFDGSRGLARTSTRPGRTQTINFYLVDEEFYLWTCRLWI